MKIPFERSPLKNTSEEKLHSWSDGVPALTCGVSGAYRRYRLLQSSTLVL
ncbi:MAG: hypothetical protein V7L25_11585 [Nostoc sp.]